MAREERKEAIRVTRWHKSHSRIAAGPLECCFECGVPKGHADTALPCPGWRCAACRSGDHASHDNQGRPWSGKGIELDAFDCKNQRDAHTQCVCRATWPRGALEAAS